MRPPKIVSSGMSYDTLLHLEEQEREHDSNSSEVAGSYLGLLAFTYSSVKLYMCIYAYIHIFIYSYIRIYTHVFINLYTYCTYTNVYTHTYVYAYIRTTYIRTYIPIPMFIC